MGGWSDDGVMESVRASARLVHVLMLGSALSVLQSRPPCVQPCSSPPDWHREAASAEPGQVCCTLILRIFRHQLRAVAISTTGQMAAVLEWCMMPAALLQVRP